MGRQPSLGQPYHLERPRPKWPDARVDQLRRLLRAGWSYSQIARIMGTTRGAVARAKDRLIPLDTLKD